MCFCLYSIHTVSTITHLPRQQFYNNTGGLSLFPSLTLKKVVIILPNDIYCSILMLTEVTVLFKFKFKFQIFTIFTTVFFSKKVGAAATFKRLRIRPVRSAPAPHHYILHFFICFYFFFKYFGKELH